MTTEDHRLFIGNLNHNTTAAGLSAFITALGWTITDCFIVHDRITHQSRGIAFVQLHEAHALKDAIAELHGQVLDGKELKVLAARPKPDRDQKPNHNYSPTEFESQAERQDA